MKLKQEVLFIPFDYDHYKSFIDMYDVYVIKNSNILFKVKQVSKPNTSANTVIQSISDKYKEVFNGATPKSLQYNVTQEHVEFIPTEQFYGFLDDYYYYDVGETRGYYFKNYNQRVFWGVKNPILKQLNKRENDLLEQIKIHDDIIKGLQKSYAKYAYNKTLNAANLADIKTNIADETNKKTAEELNLQRNKTEKDNFDAEITRLGYNNPLVVSKDQLFLVDKEYLKNSKITNYLLIKYGDTNYKINPFIDQNIANLNYDVFEKYVAQDVAQHEFIKVFYYDYNYYLKGAMSKLIEDTSGIIRIPHFNKISKQTNNARIDYIASYTNNDKIVSDKIAECKRNYDTALANFNLGAGLDWDAQVVQAFTDDYTNIYRTRAAADSEEKKKIDSFKEAILNTVRNNMIPTFNASLQNVRELFLLLAKSIIDYVNILNDNYNYL
jgi:hypothetical protein